jgi:hypothetical protein
VVSPVPAMARRRGVGRLPARLMYAGWDRRSALRRECPTSHAPERLSWHRTAGDRPCSGGVPACHGGHEHHRADHGGALFRRGMPGNHLGPGKLRAELEVVRAHYYSLLLHAGIGCVTPTTSTADAAPRSAPPAAKAWTGLAVDVSPTIAARAAKDHGRDQPPMRSDHPATVGL